MDQFSKIIADEKVKAVFNKWISHIQNEETGITVIKNMNRRTNSSENELLGEGGDATTIIDIKISAQLKKRTWKKQNKKARNLDDTREADRRKLLAVSRILRTR